MDLKTHHLMRLPAVVEAVGYSRSSIYLLIEQGKFPKPVRLAGGGAVAWRSSDVESWIAAQTTPADESKPTHHESRKRGTKPSITKPSTR